MLPGFLLSLREGLEAALIIGIVLGALRKIERPDLRLAVWGGALAAGVLSLGFALGLRRMGLTLEGHAEEIFEGVTMFVAAGILTWMIFWMYRQAQRLQRDLEANVRAAARHPGSKALFGLAFVAVLREGLELALFLTATSLYTEARLTLAGGLLGLAAATFLGWALYTSTVRLNLRRFFQVTGVLLVLFAAGLVAHGIHEFNEAGLIPAVVEHVWDVNHILDEDSLAGQVLSSLFGYNGNPSLTEILAYLVYCGGIGWGAWRLSQRSTAYQEA
ncbi:MAG: FTR1 family protein [Anaerolineales bacterium]|nr:FTR1 family protein [Anaerolineales bacterium]